jgi:hypothetical protein
MKNALKYVLLNAAQHAKLIDYIDDVFLRPSLSALAKACQNHRAASDANRPSGRPGASRPLTTTITVGVKRLDAGSVTKSPSATY